MKVVPTNKQVVQRYFNPQYQSYWSQYNNVSFSGDTFFSYNTAIAKIVEGKCGRKVLLLSDSHHSNTTAKHIYLLRCENDYLDIVRVPTVKNERNIDIDVVIERLLDRLVALRNQGLLAKYQYRKEFMEIRSMLWRISVFIKNVDVPQELIQLD